MVITRLVQRSSPVASAMVITRLVQRSSPVASAMGCGTSVLVSEFRRPEVRMDHGVQSLNFELQTSY
ncbi:unnamed protein product [Sphagnum jensenii]|uniref:Uncharacterized protein n=1 Tax=Sphagnum jensenii TaxID=128206 RepID=A0ABP1A278_9BRYO